MRTQISAMLVLFALAVPRPAAAESFESAPVQVTLYKNGLAYVVEEGRVKTDREWVETRLHGRPLLGTLRVTSKDGTRILERRGTPGAAEAATRTLAALDRRLLGQPIVLAVNGQRLAGRYLGLAHGSVGPQNSVVLEQESGTIYVPVDRIEHVSTSLTTGALEPAQTTGDDVVALRLSKTQGTVHLVSSYMTDGLGWVPTYTLDVGEKDKGTLRLEAVIVNNALDLQGVQVRFATGEAAFPLQDVASPLFQPGFDSRWIMERIMGQVRGGFNAGFDNNPVYNTMNTVQQMVSPGPPGAVSGRAAGEETHLYGPQAVTLEKEQRAALPLGEGEVPANFVYYYKAPREAANAPEQNTVWLAARLTNKLDFPLTTGPILVARKGRPVGQGFVTYTHEGGEALVPISVASSVLATIAEQELDRDGSALTFRGQRYDKVTVKGVIAVENLQGRKVRVRVEKELSGKVLSASNKGTHVEQFVSAADPNVRSTISWNLTVPAGEKKEISYRHSVYVYRHGKGSW